MNVLLTDQKYVKASGWMKNQLPENCFHHQQTFLDLPYSKKKQIYKKI